MVLIAHTYKKSYVMTYIF
ncbi:hypothetical protein F383_27666 [Gossypium arboreum]|uniref:Uncharacterized protein n=1 Tax=Gossypium arboreum TaxID=29729 RepID=A0A0B0PBJ4_GOSAR|nr:hypothetical protein F383_27666 [Gossypium arboreum]